jgi:hypothetical protein
MRLGNITRERSKTKSMACWRTSRPQSGDDGIEALFTVFLPDIAPLELEALLREPIPFGILSYESLIFILLHESVGETVRRTVSLAGVHRPGARQGAKVGSAAAYDPQRTSELRDCYGAQRLSIAMRLRFLNVVARVDRFR